MVWGHRSSIQANDRSFTGCFNGTHIGDSDSLRDHGVIHMSTLHLLHDSDINLDPDLMSPKYNMDYTNSTDTTTYTRGGEDFHMPLGWYGMVLNVAYYGDWTWLVGID